MKSFLVIGMGRFGTAVAQELTELGQEVLPSTRTPRACSASRMM